MGRMSSLTRLSGIRLGAVKAVVMVRVMVKAKETVKAKGEKEGKEGVRAVLSKTTA
jgi:hypothetical protein